MIKLEEVHLKDIIPIRNLRTDIGDLSELMTSMKQQGLLQPIGVWKEGGKYSLAFGYRRFNAAKKLGWDVIPVLVSDKKLTEEEFIIQNTMENIQRKNISPIELGKMCNLLRELGLSVSEVSTHLGISVSKVKVALLAYQSVPTKYRNYIGTDAGSLPKRGNISATAVSVILSAHIGSAKDIERIFQLAKEEELTIEKLRLIVSLVSRGISPNKAYEYIEELLVFSPKLVVWKAAKWNLSEKYKIPMSQVISQMLIGKIPLDRGLIANKEDFEDK